MEMQALTSLFWRQTECLNYGSIRSKLDAETQKKKRKIDYQQKNVAQIPN